MQASKVFALIFSILLTTTSLTSIPLLKAETPSTNPQASASINQQTLANYVVGVTANRVPLKLIPLPSVSIHQGVQIGPTSADIIVLAIPATQKSGNIDLIGFITGFLTKAAERQEDLSGHLIADLYSSLYDRVIQMGAKQAFLPYENLTFTFIIIIWIKSKSLGEFIASVGADMLKSVSDSLILISFSLTDTVLQQIKNNIKQTINNIATNFNNKINNELDKINNELINYINQKIDNMQCNQFCEIINQIVRICNFMISPINIYATVETTYKDGLISVSLKIDKLSWSYKDDNNIAIQSKNIFLQMVNGIIVSQTYDKELINIDKVDSVINTIGGFIYDRLMETFSPQPASMGFTIRADGIYPSCEAAKTAMKEAAKTIVTQIIISMKKEVSERITQTVKQINQTIDAIFKDISTTLSTITNNLRNVANEAVNYAKEFLETSVQTAISQAIMAANPAVFAVYAVAEGISQALQTCVSSVSITARPPQIDNLDKSVLIVEERQGSTRELIREVRPPGPNDAVTAEKGTSLGEKVFSAAKGFAAGVLGAIFGSATKKVINAIPSVFVVNVQLKSDNKWLIAPSWPGIYAINLKVTPRTYAAWLSSLPGNLMSVLFKNIKNDLVTRLEQLFNVDLSQNKASQGGGESGADMILPYLVLPPYFIVERVKIENGIVSMKFVAVYDFSALMRIFIDEQINKFREIVNKATEVADKLCEMIKSMIKSIVNQFANMVISYYTSKFSIEFIEKLIKELYNYLIDLIFTKFINPILDQFFEKYIKAHIVKFIEFINGILNRIEQQLELFDRYLALTLSVIRVDVVNCDIELTPALPSLGFISSHSIDRFGKVDVQLSQSIFYKFMGNCLGAIPLYRSVGRDGRVSYFIAPWAASSLEPVVTPLIPVARVLNNKLNAVFLSPFVNSLTNVRYALVVDGVEVREVPVDTLQKAAIIGVRVLSVWIDDTRGVGAILPLPIESPILVNPSILADKV